MSEILYSARSRGLRPRRRRRLAKALSWTLLTLGVLALADVGVTMLWREPVSALIAALQEPGLESQLSRVQSASEEPTLRERLVLERLQDRRRRVAFLARRMERELPNGSAVGRIYIPAIKAEFVLVKGTGTSELEEGPGIYSHVSYPGVSFPGLAGTTAIAGHRTTWLEPFRRIGELHRGEHIVIAMPYAKLTYTITGRKVVLPSNVAAAILRVPGPPRLVLSACTPLFSAENRMLVYARLTSMKPVGAALIVKGRRASGLLGPLGRDAERMPAAMKA